MTSIRVAVCGAAGKMGQTVVAAVARQSDMKLVAGIDQTGIGEDVTGRVGLEPSGATIADDLTRALKEASPDVMVDFTHAAAARESIPLALRYRVACVVGTTGLTAADLEEIRQLCRTNETPAFIAPNFALGAVLLMQFASQAARYFDVAEIMELHHDQKRDAPSGTALRIAQLMEEAPESRLSGASSRRENEPSRGLGRERIRVHSVRLPGLLAHHEVIFGAPGEVLTLRHDSTSRDSFLPGILLAIRKVRGLAGLVVGLENLL